MTVTSLAQSHIVHSRSSVFKKEICRKDKAKRLLAMALIFIIIITLLFYILQVNSTAANGYKIRGLKKKIEELESRNKVLQINVSNLKSVQFLESKIENFDMVKAQTIEYVDLPVSVVAAR